MTAQAIADSVLEIESRVAELDWRWRGVNVWPMYRCLLMLRFFCSMTGSADPSIGRPKLRQLLGKQSGAGGPANARSRCTVLLNDGFSLQMVGGCVIDRFCTPLSLGLDRLGIDNLLLDQGFAETHGLATRSERIGPRVFRAKALASALARVKFDPWTQERVSQLRRATEAAGLDPETIPGARALLARQMALVDLAGYFETLLRRVGADQVFQVSYYSVAGHAMNLAARRVGASVIDVQHGVIGRQHLAYVDWSLPEAQNELLPTGYWTWGPHEAGILREGTASTADVVVAGGHPLVSAWRANWLPGMGEARKDARALRATHPHAKHILVALQPGLMGREEMASVLDAMRRVSSAFWWIRLHPTSRGSSELSGLFAETGAHYDVQRASDLPLYAVLENTDVNVSHSSTTVIEAAAFGVPSIVWSTYGAEFFSDLIHAGAASVALDSDRMVTLLAATSKTSNGAGVSGAHDLLAALQTFSTGPAA